MERNNKYLVNYLDYLNKIDYLILNGNLVSEEEFNIVIDNFCG